MKLKEEMQKIIKTWESSNTKVDQKRGVIPENFPPDSLLNTIKQTMGIDLVKLEKSAIEMKEPGKFLFVLIPRQSSIDTRQLKTEV